MTPTPGALRHPQGPQTVSDLSDVVLRMKRAGLSEDGVHAVSPNGAVQNFQTTSLHKHYSAVPPPACS
jgi:hypothetical protein